MPGVVLQEPKGEASRVSVAKRAAAIELSRSSSASSSVAAATSPLPAPRRIPGASPASSSSPTGFASKKALPSASPSASPISTTTTTMGSSMIYPSQLHETVTSTPSISSTDASPFSRRAESASEPSAPGAVIAKTPISSRSSAFALRLEAFQKPRIASLAFPLILLSSNLVRGDEARGIPAGSSSSTTSSPAMSASAESMPSSSSSASPISTSEAPPPPTTTTSSSFFSAFQLNEPSPASACSVSSANASSSLHPASETEDATSPGAGVASTPSMASRSSAFASRLEAFQKPATLSVSSFALASSTLARGNDDLRGNPVGSPSPSMKSPSGLPNSTGKPISIGAATPTPPQSAATSVTSCPVFSRVQLFNDPSSASPVSSVDASSSPAPPTSRGAEKSTALSSTTWKVAAPPPSITTTTISSSVISHSQLSLFVSPTEASPLSRHIEAEKAKETRSSAFASRLEAFEKKPRAPGSVSSSLCFFLPATSTPVRENASRGSIIPMLAASSSSPPKESPSSSSWCTTSISPPPATTKSSSVTISPFKGSSSSCVSSSTDDSSFLAQVEAEKAFIATPSSSKSVFASRLEAFEKKSSSPPSTFSSSSSCALSSSTPVRASDSPGESTTTPSVASRIQSLEKTSAAATTTSSMLSPTATRKTLLLLGRGNHDENSLVLAGASAVAPNHFENVKSQEKNAIIADVAVVVVVDFSDDEEVEAKSSFSKIKPPSVALGESSCLGRERSNNPYAFVPKNPHRLQLDDEKKSTDAPSPHILSLIDEAVFSIPCETQTPEVASLARSIRAKVTPLIPSSCSSSTRELCELRGFMRWIGFNIGYDMDGRRKGLSRSSDANDTLKTCLGVCEQYADLLAKLSLVDDRLRVRVVVGLSKGETYRAGDPIDAALKNHAWNIVKVSSGKEYLLDPTWATGSATGTENGGSFHREWCEHYWLTSPDEFIVDHFPESESDQLLPETKRVTLSEYEKLPFVRAAYWRARMTGMLERGILVCSGETKLEFRVSSNFRVSAYVMTGSLTTTFKHHPELCCVQRLENEKVVVLVRPPAGESVLRVFTREEREEGACGAIDFLLKPSSTGFVFAKPFPELTSDESGLLAPLNKDLVRNSVCAFKYGSMDAGDLQVVLPGGNKWITLTRTTSTADHGGVFFEGCVDVGNVSGALKVCARKADAEARAPYVVVAEYRVV